MKLINLPKKMSKKKEPQRFILLTFEIMLVGGLLLTVPNPRLAIGIWLIFNSFVLILVSFLVYVENGEDKDA